MNKTFSMLLTLLTATAARVSALALVRHPDIVVHPVKGLNAAQLEGNFYAI